MQSPEITQLREVSPQQSPDSPILHWLLSLSTFPDPFFSNWMMPMFEYCLKCKEDLHGVMHVCLGHKIVVSPPSYHEAQRTSHPLDRLTVGEMITISGGDADATLRHAEELLEISNAEYFKKPLTYRIEFESLSAELGFRAVIDGSAILTEGHSDENWSNALQFINESGPAASMLLSENETYLCRLVSHDSEGRKYVWGVKRLECLEQTGWIFSDWV